MEIIILLFIMSLSSSFFTLTKKIPTKININTSEIKLLNRRLIGNNISIASTKNVGFLKFKIFIFFYIF